MAFGQQKVSKYCRRGVLIRGVPLYIVSPVLSYVALHYNIIYIIYYIYYIVPIYCVCRRGNHSQLAAQLLSEHFASSEVKDIVGGLTAWHLTVDPSFPTY